MRSQLLTVLFYPCYRVTLDFAISLQENVENQKEVFVFFCLFNLQALAFYFGNYNKASAFARKQLIIS